MVSSRLLPLRHVIFILMSTHVYWLTYLFTLDPNLLDSPTFLISKTQLIWNFNCETLHILFIPFISS